MTRHTHRTTAGLVGYRWILIALAIGSLGTKPVACPGDPDVSVTSYAALRAYVGKGITALVTDRRTFGIFAAGTRCTVDNATCILGADGRYWQRRFTEYHPEFWELGKISLPGMVPQDEAGAITLAGRVAAAATTKRPVRLNRIYETSHTVFIYPNVSYLGGGIGGLRRACAPATTLTAAVRVGDSCLTVASTKGFKAAGIHTVTVSTSVNNAGTRGQLLVYTLDAKAKRLCAPPKWKTTWTAPVGAKVFATHDLFSIWGGSRPGYTKGIVLDGLTFDGNRACNANTADWRYNTTGDFRGVHRVERCLFYNTPSENLTTCGATLNANVALDLGGSFLHKSCSMNPPPTETITSNWVVGANIMTDAVMAHSEGAITLSVNAGELDVRNNVFVGGAEGVFGWIGADDANIKARGNWFESFPRKYQLAPGHPFASTIDIVTGNTWVRVP